MNSRKLVLLCATFLAGCSLVGQQETPPRWSQSEISPEETNVPSHQAAMLTPSALEINPSVTPWVSPTIPPGLMPMPSATTVDATLFVTELLETNGGCELPCWWGITPGITRWEEVWQRIAGSVDQSQTGAPIFQELESHYEIDIFFPVSGKIWQPGDTPHFLYGQTYWFRKQDHVVEALWAYVGRDAAPQYSLNRILTRFGQPTQILLGDKFYPASGHTALGLKMVYQDLGLLFMFEEVWGPDNEPSPVVCFSKGPHVIVWEKNSIIAEDVAQDRAITFVPVNLTTFTDIDSVSGESISEFYQRYIAAESENCVDVDWDALH